MSLMRRKVWMPTWAMFLARNEMTVRTWGCVRQIASYSHGAAGIGIAENIGVTPAPVVASCPELTTNAISHPRPRAPG
ncbi:hypothetical protein SVIOM74S_06809 [Streptomyces violarus]